MSRGRFGLFALQQHFAARALGFQIKQQR